MVRSGPDFLFIVSKMQKEGSQIRIDDIKIKMTDLYTHIYISFIIYANIT